MINVIGLGYIGLPTSLILAANGNDVVGTDVNKALVDTLNDGIVTFEEKGLRELYNSAKEGGIRFQDSYLNSADIYIVTVPTPYLKESHKIDTSYLENALESIGSVCKNNSIIVIESTVSPGTIDNVVRPIINDYDKKISLVHAPERILPGSMINELINNARTIGADDVKVAHEVKDIYATFCKASITLTDINTAEMTKVVENTYRDINIAFSNELSEICKEANLDVYEVIEIANQHPRVNILTPGPGVGGHCIPVDPWFLISDYPEHTKLIKKARIINQEKPKRVLEMILEIMNRHNINDFSNVGIYGITYKENVDDVRESPTLQLYEIMKDEFSSFPIFYDPYLNNKVIPNQTLNEAEFLDQKRLLIIMVAHDKLRNLQVNKDMIIFDTKNTRNFNTNVKYNL